MGSPERERTGAAVSTASGMIKDELQTGPFDRASQLQEYLGAAIEHGICNDELLDLQTDKSVAKIVGCTECKRPVVVNRFYAPAWAKCAACKGEASGGERGSVVAVQAGRTEPEMAVDLTLCLINPEFAELSCVKCGEPMELKNVNHNDEHGPFHYEHDKSGKRVKVRDAIGETVMHQCNHCRLIVSMTTTAESVFRRQNEPKARERNGPGANNWGMFLGSREELV